MKGVLSVALLLCLLQLGNCLTGLQIIGNQIYTLDKDHIVLRGVDRSGTEFMCVQGYGIFDGPNDQSSVSSIKSWRVNAVRVPLNEDCWLGINGVKAEYAGQNYINAVVQFVNLLNNNGIYVIVDLHWAAAGSTLATQQTPMPDSDHSPAFWTSVAKTFSNNLAVIFDLFNEPYPNNNVFDSTAAWQCWKNGGGSCNGLGYTAAGMQDLVTAVRNTGAKNIIMLGGLAYSNSLTQWLTYLPDDPIKQLAASWHSYNFNYCNNEGCWNQYVAPVAAQHPIIAGEMGENDCAHGYIDGLMAYCDAHNISYLGWTWNTWDCSSGPALISNYDGTATNFGVGLKNHLASVAN